MSILNKHFADLKEQAALLSACSFQEDAKNHFSTPIANTYRNQQKIISDSLDNSITSLVSRLSWSQLNDVAGKMFGHRIKHPNDLGDLQVVHIEKTTYLPVITFCGMDYITQSYEFELSALQVNDKIHLLGVIESVIEVANPH